MSSSRTCRLLCTNAAQTALTAIILSHWFTGIARAQETEPPLAVSMGTVVVFLLLFLFFCVGLVWWIYKNEKRSRKEQDVKKSAGEPNKG